jgi:hypothetical protein
MRNTILACGRAWLPVLAFGIVGCSWQPGRLATHPVRGEVRCAGKPAVGVQLYLRRADGAALPEMPINPHAVSGPDGQFTFSTYEPADGAPAGDYVILLHWFTDARESTQDRLQGLFADPKKQLTATVKATGENVLPPIPLPAVDANGKPMNTRPARND